MALTAQLHSISTQLFQLGWIYDHIVSLATRCLFSKIDYWVLLKLQINLIFSQYFSFHSPLCPMMNATQINISCFCCSAPMWSSSNLDLGEAGSRYKGGLQFGRPASSPRTSFLLYPSKYTAVIGPSSWISVIFHFIKESFKAEGSRNSPITWAFSQLRIPDLNTLGCSQ